MINRFKLVRIAAFFCVQAYCFPALCADYKDFRLAAKARDEAHTKEGFSFIVGGALGLITSVTLGITTKETLPKIGYTVVLGLSSGALIHGTSLYMLGDQDSRDHFLFSNFEAELMRYPALSDADREDILERLQVLNSQHWKSRSRDVAIIRGSLEALTAVSAGATVYFSRLKKPASQIGLGLLAVGSLIASVSDFLSSASTSELKAGETQTRVRWNYSPLFARNEFLMTGVSAQVQWNF